MIKEEKTAKELHTQLQFAEGELEAMNIKLNNIKREIQSKREMINKIKDRISSLNNHPVPQISEHAFLRYFERIKGFNLDEIKKEILSDDILEFINKLGNGTFPKKDYNVVVKNKTVITINNL